MMNRSLFKLVTFFLVAILLLYFGTKLTFTLASYARLTKSEEFPLLGKKIVEKKGKYFVLGRFSISGEEVEIPISPPFLNRYTAENWKERTSYKIFYNPKNPKEGTIFKSLPYKQIISLAIIVIVSLYFYWLFQKKRV